SRPPPLQTRCPAVPRPLASRQAANQRLLPPRSPLPPRRAADQRLLSPRDPARQTADQRHLPPPGPAPPQRACRPITPRLHSTPPPPANLGTKQRVRPSPASLRLVPPRRAGHPAPAYRRGSPARPHMTNPPMAARGTEQRPQSPRLLARTGREPSRQRPAGAIPPCPWPFLRPNPGLARRRAVSPVCLRRDLRLVLVRRARNVRLLVRTGRRLSGRRGRSACLRRRPILSPDPVRRGRNVRLLGRTSPSECPRRRCPLVPGLGSRLVSRVGGRMGSGCWWRGRGRGTRGWWRRWRTPGGRWGRRWRGR